MALPAGKFDVLSVETSRPVRVRGLLALGRERPPSTPAFGGRAACHAPAGIDPDEPKSDLRNAICT